MGKIKDNLGLGRKQVMTLQPSEIKFLRDVNVKFQAKLDEIMQQTAADFLHYVAVNRLEYPPDVDLRFNFITDKNENNLEITVAPE